MKTITIPDGTSRRFSKRRFAGAAAAIALVATGAVGAQTFAGDEVGGPTPPPGEQVAGQPPDAPTDEGDPLLGSDAFIQTGGSNFDPTVVSKFIPAHGFQVLQGTGAQADLVVLELGEGARTCLTPDPMSGGLITRMAAGVELPDGSLIKRVSFYGQDNDAVENINVRLYRQDVVTPFVIQGTTPISTRTSSQVDSFSTSGQQSSASVFFGADDLAEPTGTPSSGALAITGTTNRFHTIHVELRTTAAVNHVLCGVRVDYQVPVPADPGTVFHPLDPVRAFDSRLAVLPESGRLGPNETKVIDITDGYDSNGVAIPAQANAVPTTATAVAYNVTIAGADGPNFVAVTAGDATEFTASAVNYSAGSNVANGSTVTIAADQTIKLWGGSNTGSSHVLIDIVGYYAPSVRSNMAN
jgi:hypothetical protein